MPGGERVGGVYYEVEARNEVERGLREARGDIHRFANEVRSTDATFDVEARTRELKTALAEVQATKKAIEAEKAELEIGIDEKMFGRQTATAKKAAADLGDELKQLTVAEKRLQEASKNLANSVGKSTEAHMKEQAVIAKLRQRYAELYTAQQKVYKQDRFRTTDRERLAAAKLESELNSLAATIRKLGGSTDDLNVDLDRSEGILRRLGRSFASTRLHLGVLSTTIAGASKGLLFFAPVVSSVIGVVSSLIGVLGTSLAGAAAVGGAGIAGIGLAFFGLKTALREPMAELGAAVDALGKYDEAVADAGKGSAEAEEALAALNSTLGGLPPDARKAFTEFAKARSAFSEQTSGLRKPFFETISEGLKTATALMPIFARETTATGKVLAQETQSWFAGLRSQEGKDILGDLMGNFRKSLPGLMGGLGNLGTMLGRITQSASRFSPALANGFERWAQSMEDGMGKGQTLDQRVGRWINHMRQFGSTAQAGGRALATFFGAGADEGENMLKSMQRTFNGWTRWMKSVEGSADLRNFFADAKDTMGAFLPALGNMAVTLGNIAEATQPVVEGIASITGAAMNLISLVPPGFLRIAGTIGAAALALNRFGLLAPVAAGVGGLTRALLGTGAGFELVATGSRASQVGLAALTAVVGTPALLPFAALTGGVIALGMALDDSTYEVNAIDTALGKADAAMKQLPARANAYAEASTRVSQASKAASRAIEETGRSSLRTQIAESRLVVAHNALVRAQRDLARVQTTSVKQSMIAADEATSTYVNTLQSTNPVFTQYIRSQAALTGRTAQFDAQLALNGNTVRGTIQSARNLGIQWDANRAEAAGVTAALRNMNQQLDMQVANALNAARASLQTGTLSRKAALEVGRFAQAFRKIPAAKKLALRVEDQQALGKFASVSNKLNGLGRKGRQNVIRIMGDDTNIRQKVAAAEAALAKIRARKTRAKIEAETGGAKAQIAGFDRALEDTTRTRRSVQIKANANQAITEANSAKTAIDNVPDLHITEFRATRTGNWSGSPGRFMGGPGFAEGGRIDRMMERAYAAADRRSAIDGPRGARVTRPTYVTGEENRTEYVIATNPAYRRANVGYLSAAAEDLGYGLIPGYKKGKKPPKYGSAGTSTPGYDDAPGPSTAGLDALNAALSIWQQEYDLDRRDYDRGVLGGGGGYHGASSLSDLLYDLQQQYNIYQTMGAKGGPLDVLLNTAPQKAPKTPKGLQAMANKTIKKGKKAGQPTKSAKTAQAQLDRYDKEQTAASEYNSSLKSLQDEMEPTMASIPFLMRGIQIEMDELIKGDQANQAAEAFSLDTARMDVFRQFGSNIRPAGIGGVALPGGASSLSFGAGAGVSVAGGATTPSGGLTTASNPSGVTGAGLSGTGGSSSAGGATIIDVDNYFSAPPADPHTWSQGLAYELGAAL